MRRVEGSLTTGTYLVFTRPNNGELLANAKERSNGTGHEISSTMNRNDENVEWYYESLGNDHLRAYNKKCGTSFIPSSYAEGALIDQECPPIVLIMRETETKGEYHISFAENTSWYIGPAKHGYKVSKEPSRWSFYKVDT